jgi:hypothetical protein
LGLSKDTVQALRVLDEIDTVGATNDPSTARRVDLLGSEVTVNERSESLVKAQDTAVLVGENDGEVVTVSGNLLP